MAKPRAHRLIIDKKIAIEVEDYPLLEKVTLQQKKNSELLLSHARTFINFLLFIVLVLYSNFENPNFLMKISTIVSPENFTLWYWILVMLIIGGSAVSLALSFKMFFDARYLPKDFPIPSKKTLEIKAWGSQFEEQEDFYKSTSFFLTGNKR